MNKTFDTIIVGAGIMGSTVALFLARAGKKVLLIDKSQIFRSASGSNAGTLTIHMTRASLVPYALKGWEMWMNLSEWLSRDIEVKHQPGLCLAFTEEEEKLLVERSKIRNDNGANIKILNSAEAQKIEPSLSKKIRCAAFSEIDGYAYANQTGLAYKKALQKENITILENSEVIKIKKNAKFSVTISNKNINQDYYADQIVLACGVWLGEILKMMNVKINLKCLAQQLIVTERMNNFLNSVITIANGKLSLKQFSNGNVLIGGGWPGVGETKDKFTSTIPENLIGNIRLACYTTPELKNTRISRIWLGLEAETDDAMPIIGKIPDNEGAYIIGSVHSGYTSGPYMGKLLSEYILGKNVNLDSFNISRLIQKQ